MKENEKGITTCHCKKIKIQGKAAREEKDKIPI